MPARRARSPAIPPGGLDFCRAPGPPAHRPAAPAQLDCRRIFFVSVIHPPFSHYAIDLSIPDKNRPKCRRRDNFSPPIVPIPPPPITKPPNCPFPTLWLALGRVVTPRLVSQYPPNRPGASCEKSHPQHRKPMTSIDIPTNIVSASPHDRPSRTAHTPGPRGSHGSDLYPRNLPPRA